MKKLGLVAVAVLVPVSFLTAVRPAAAAAPGGAGGALVRATQFSGAELPRGAVDLGRYGPGHSVSVEVVLGSSDPTGEQALADDLYNRDSPLYHRWLTPSEFDADFGPAPTTVSSTETWLESRGLKPVRQSEFALEVSGPATRVAAAFGTSLESYRVDGSIGYAAQQAPLVPEGLAPGISGILGLNTLERPRAAAERYRPASGSPGPKSARTSGSSASIPGAPSDCSGGENAVDQEADGAGYTMYSEAEAYGTDQLWQAGLEGQGQKIGLFELATFNGNDIIGYEQCSGISVPVGQVRVDGGSQPDYYYGGTFEADLDVEQAATQAPGASITVYDAPDNGNPSVLYDLWNSIVTQDSVETVSTSWGECEPDSDTGTVSSIDGLLEQAALQGQSVFTAAGDSGSEDCTQDYYSGFAKPPAYWSSLEVDYPSSSPWVTAVGGTDLALQSDSPETTVDAQNVTTWNYCVDTGPFTTDPQNSPCVTGNDQGYAAGGGGLSTREQSSPWQESYLTAAGDAHPDNGGACGSSCREVPDVAMDAGYPIAAYASSLDSGGEWGLGDGTSFAAPFLAGLTADRNQGCSTSTGSFAALSYSLAASPSADAAAFVDVDTGNNDMLESNSGDYPAVSGYDMATGLGVPVPDAFSCPEVASVSPADAAPGRDVTVTGIGLEDATIWFGGTAATVAPDTTPSATSVTVVVPGGSGSTDVYGSENGVSGTETYPFAFAGGGTGPATCATASGSRLPGSVGLAAVDINGCPGYFIVDAQGRVAAFGSATNHGDLSGIHLSSPIVAIAATPDGRGYMLLSAAGGVFAYGDATFHGSMAGQLNAPAVAIAFNPNSGGYWLLSANGGIFSFDTGFYGSEGGHGPKLGSPMVGLAVAPGGYGYWLVSAAGGVFAFTPYGFHGSGVGRTSSPVVGIASSSNGGGYTLVSSAGGAINFGDAPAYPSLYPSPARAIVDIAPTPSAAGYYLVNPVGSVFVEGSGTGYFGNA